ncbi:hypothetical protein [Litoribacter populi]|uniref:hypothetical protein n=1 Tax=Litoribacter populi TaxID=2598460 RepID=UPI00117BEE1A|nr:hypothetical protein [Litoribacter populi]
MKTKIGISWLRLLLIAVAMMLVGCISDQLDDLDLAQEPDLMLEEELTDENLRVNPAAQNQLLASVRKATAKYQRMEVAIADGYAPASPCVVDFINNTGAMGVHLVNFDLVDGELDPNKPEALVYEPLPGGKYKLVALEYIVVADLLEDRNIAPKFGQVPMDNHLQGAPLDFPHYQLHVWVWKNNPSGMYTPYNPKVSCAYFVDDGNDHH